MRHLCSHGAQGSTTLAERGCDLVPIGLDPPRRLRAEADLGVIPAFSEESGA
jgi:hypothetical protein